MKYFKFLLTLFVALYFMGIAPMALTFLSTNPEICAYADDDGDRGDDNDKGKGKGHDDHGKGKGKGHDDHGKGKGKGHDDHGNGNGNGHTDHGDGSGNGHGDDGCGSGGGNNGGGNGSGNNGNGNGNGGGGDPGGGGGGTEPPADMIQVISYNNELADVSKNENYEVIFTPGGTYQDDHVDIYIDHPTYSEMDGNVMDAVTVSWETGVRNRITGESLWTDEMSLVNSEKIWFQDQDTNAHYGYHIEGDSMGITSIKKVKALQEEGYTGEYLADHYSASVKDIYAKLGTIDQLQLGDDLYSLLAVKNNFSADTETQALFDDSMLTDLVYVDDNLVEPGVPSPDTKAVEGATRRKLSHLSDAEKQYDVSNALALGIIMTKDYVDLDTVEIGLRDGEFLTTAEVDNIAAMADEVVDGFGNIGSANKTAIAQTHETREEYRAYHNGFQNGEFVGAYKVYNKELTDVYDDLELKFFSTENDLTSVTEFGLYKEGDIATKYTLFDGVNIAEDSLYEFGWGNVLSWEDNHFGFYAQLDDGEYIYTESEFNDGVVEFISYLNLESVEGYDYNLGEYDNIDAGGSYSWNYLLVFGDEYQFGATIRHAGHQNPEIPTSVMFMFGPAIGFGWSWLKRRFWK